MALVLGASSPTCSPFSKEASDVLHDQDLGSLLYPTTPALRPLWREDQWRCRRRGGGRRKIREGKGVKEGSRANAAMSEQSHRSG